MTTMTPNKSEMNRTPDNMSLGNAWHKIEVIAARLQMQLSKEPLLSSLRQSPRPANKAPLALEKIERSLWNLNKYPMISGALQSNTFSYILKRAAIIPSKLFRRMDLPLFRWRHEPGRNFRKSGNTTSDRPQNAVTLQTDETFINMPLLHASGDNGKREWLSQVSDGSSNVIPKPFPILMPFNPGINNSHVLHPVNSPITDPSVALQSSNIHQTEAVVDTPDVNDNQPKLYPRNTSLITSGRQNIFPEIKGGLSRSIISGLHPQKLYCDRTLSRLLSPFKPGISRPQEIAERNLPADSIREIPETPKRSKSIIYMTNMHEKPIAVPSAGKIKSVPTKLPLLKQLELSSRFSPHYDQVSEWQIDDDQTNNTTPVNPVSKKIRPSISLSQDFFEEPLFQSQSSQKVDFGEPLTDYHEQNKHALISKEQTFFSEPETKPGILKQHPPTLHNTMSRKIIPSFKPMTLKNDMSGKVFSDARFEQDNSGFDNEATGKSGCLSMSGKKNNYHSKSLNITQLKKNGLSGENPAVNEVISRPLSDRKQSSPPQPAAEPSVMQKQRLEAMGKNISLKAVQSVIPQSQDITAGKPLKSRSFQKIESPVELAHSSYQDRLPVKGTDTSVSAEPEIVASTPLNQNKTADTLAVCNKTGESFTTLSKHIINGHLSKSLVSHQAIKIAPRRIYFERDNFSSQELISRSAANRTGYDPGTIFAGKKIIKDISDPDTPGAALHDGTAVVKGFLKSNNSEPLLNRKTGALNNAFTGQYPILGNIYRSLKYSPPGIAGDNSVILAGAENTASPGYYKYNNQPSLDLTVVSALQTQKDKQAIQSEKLSRSLSGTHAGLIISSPSHHALNLPSMPVSRIVEPRLQNQTMVNQPVFEKKSNKETAQDIRIIADKVYAILKHELKIERARERHHLLR